MNATAPLLSPSPAPRVATAVPSDPVIDVTGLGVRYGFRGAPVLADLDLRVEPGEVRVLLGRNGAGKSSLVRCLLGHQKPSGGRVELFGADVWRRRARLMRRVGVVPEEPDAPPALTARELSRHCARLYARWDTAGVEERLHRFEVPVDRPVGRLSKGQKGQVHLALALGHSPDLLVLDDPTLGFDAVARRAFFEELVEDLAENETTVFLTTHDLAGVETIATRVALLAGGRLRVDEDLEALRERVRRVSVTLGDPDADLRALLARWGPGAPGRVGRRFTVVVERWDDALPGRVAEAGGTDVEVSTLGLEEIFLALTGGGGDSDSAPSTEGEGSR